MSTMDSSTSFTTQSPPFDLAKNHGPIVNIVAWLLLVISTLSTVSRLASKYAFAKKLQRDDLLAFFALVRLSNLDLGIILTISSVST